jgi:hypothetical protein
MPEEHLTCQDLIYIARALRVGASVDATKATEGEFVSSRTVFDDSTSEQRALAEKVERIAKRRS